MVILKSTQFNLYLLDVLYWSCIRVFDNLAKLKKKIDEGQTDSDFIGESIIYNCKDLFHVSINL